MAVTITKTLSAQCGRVLEIKTGPNGGKTLSIADGRATTAITLTAEEVTALKGEL